MTPAAGVFNYEEQGKILIKSSTILARTIFKNKYGMKDITEKMGAAQKFKPEFFEANEDYWGRVLYENRTALE